LEFKPWRHALASERDAPGVIRTFEPEMSSEERQALEANAANLTKSASQPQVVGGIFHPPVALTTLV
jgi:hypothetical protein